MANVLEPIKNTKNLKSLLTNLLRRGLLKTTSRAAGWAALSYKIGIRMMRAVNLPASRISCWICGLI